MQRARHRDVIFKTYSLGINTNRDVWAYNFNRNTLAENISGMIETYNEQVFKRERQANRDANVDDFVDYDDKKIKLERIGLKTEAGKAGRSRNFCEAKGPDNPSIARLRNQTSTLIRTMIER